MGGRSGGTIRKINPAGIITTVPYDNTANFQTGVALANLTSSPVTVTASIWDQSGSQIDMQSFTLLANGHIAFNVATQSTAIDNN